LATFNLSDYPKEIQKKVTLYHHFKNYLTGEENKTNRDSMDLSSAMMNPSLDIYVKKWMKTPHAILFRLSNKVVQVVFHDETEIILSSESRVVTYVNKKHERINYPLSSALESENYEMVKRLKYTKEILTKMLGGGNSQPTTNLATPSHGGSSTPSIENTLKKNSGSLGIKEII
jgi:polo-like kinase 1